MKNIITIFGEAEKGQYKSLIKLDNLEQLVNKLGNPTESGVGIHMAIQILMYNQNIIYYRISEEGFNKKEYITGFNLIEKTLSPAAITAIALPGVGDSNIIDLAANVCNKHKSLLIINEKDFYDFMTQSNN